MTALARSGGPPTPTLCPHQPGCPGCPRLAERGLPPGPLARLMELAAEHGVTGVPSHTGPRTGFRYRARLAIRGRADAPKLGIFEAGSHRAVHIPRCLVHHPVLNRIAEKTRDTLAKHRIPTYSDAAHAGVLRYLQVVLERKSERAQVTLITNGSSPEGLSELLADLQGALEPDLHSLWWNGNPAHANTILGPHWQHCFGEPHVVDVSGSARLFYPPGAFGQSNLDLAMQLAARVRELSRPGERVTEFYAGVGAIGLGLAESAGSLRLNELGAGSLEGLARGVEALPPEQRQRVSIHPGAAGELSALAQDSDFVIADPPRKGLDPQLTAALVAAPPERLAYVSCDVESLLRDAARLTPALRLRTLETYDLFPHTEHLETLAVFER